MSKYTVVDVDDSTGMEAEELKFHDSGQDDILFDKGKMQTHTFTDFPNTAESDEEDQDKDKSQLLKEEKKALSFWTFEYYQQFFDVETSQVFHRIVGSMLPLPNRNYLQTHVRPSPDLYGPFWICTTLVFTTAIAGNLANYLSTQGADYQWKYDFHKVTFSATAIFSYWWLVPTCLYGVLWWRQSQAGVTFLEMICVYGYSLAIYIPISILWVVNYTWFKWLLVIIGALLSGGVLVITFWPTVKNDSKKIAIAVIAMIFILHAALAAGFMLYFFHVPAVSIPTISPVTDAPGKPTTQAPQLPEAALQGQDAPDPAVAGDGVGPGDKGTQLGSDGSRNSRPEENQEQNDAVDGDTRQDQLPERTDARQTQEATKDTKQSDTETQVKSGHVARRAVKRTKA